MNKKKLLTPSNIKSIYSISKFINNRYKSYFIYPIFNKNSLLQKDKYRFFLNAKTIKIYAHGTNIKNLCTTIALDNMDLEDKYNEIFHICHNDVEDDHNHLLHKKIFKIYYGMKSITKFGYNYSYYGTKGKRKTMDYNIVNKFLDKGFNIQNPVSIIENNLIQSISRSIKVRYGEEILISDYDAKGANLWIKKYDKKFNNRKKNQDDNLVDTQFLFKLDDNTFCFAQIGSFIDQWNVLLNRGNINHSGMAIYIFGKHYKKYVKEFKDILKMKNDTSIYIYNIKGYSHSDNNDQGVDSIGTKLERRPIDTLFFNDHIKEKVFDHIDNFLINKELYESKGLSYKTGILLYGAPGTGKTSFATALASKYNYNIIVVDMTTFDKLDINTLSICINADESKYIVLLEDIDTLFTSLNREDNNIDKDERKIVNKMLQFLDSSSSPNDVIFIATTNHIEMLDEALTRDGRFDLKLEIGNLEKETALEMIKSFNINDEKLINEILSICKNDKGLYNPAKLQNVIISKTRGISIANNQEENNNE